MFPVVVVSEIVEHDVAKVTGSASTLLCTAAELRSVRDLPGLILSTVSQPFFFSI